MAKKPIVVLSLFDGCSCAQVALKRAKTPIIKYYASETDKFVIQITQKNHPNTIQLGDVQDWKNWDIEQPDLLIGGSPCQGFSYAGKQLNFEDSRSKLFFEFVEILYHYKPKYFLFENVRMKKEHEDVITRLLGVTPVEINSALVSAQTRKRLYWCNWKLEQPKDKKIHLKEIFDYHKQTDWEKKMENALRKKNKKLFEKEYLKIDRKGAEKNVQDKSSCVAGGHRGDGNHSDMDLIILDDKVRRYSPVECERLQTLEDNYTEGVSNTQRYKMLGNAFTVDVVAYILSCMLGIPVKINTNARNTYKDTYEEHQISL